MAKQLLNITLFLLFAIPSISQELGKPFIHNYTPKEYKASIQNWAIGQDNRGVLYFGNNAGLLEYDATKWNLVPITNGVRSLSVDNEKGVIYVGTSGELGYVSPDSLGTLKFTSLLDKVPDEDKDYVEVWKIHKTSQGVYFQSFQVLLFWSNDGEMKIWHPKISFYYSFYLNNRLYIKEIDGSLYEMRGSELRKVEGSEAIADKFIQVMLPYGEDKILIGTKANGLYLFNHSKKGPSSFTKIKTDADDIFLEKELYHMAVLPNGDFAVATLEGGIIVINRSGEIIQIIDDRANLQDQTVYYLYVDQHQSLWAALDNGISRVDADSPFSWWDEGSGLRGIVFGVTRHEGVLYAGTSDGVFYEENDVFLPVQGINGQCWDLVSATLSKEYNNKKVLLGANANGIYEIKGNKAKMIRDKRYTFKLYQRVKESNRIFAGSQEGLVTIRYDKGKWIDEISVPGTDVEVQSMASDLDGNLWLGTRFQGVIRVHFENKDDITSANAKFFSTENGLPTMNFIQVYPHQKDLVFATEKGMFIFDPLRETFLPDTSWHIQFSDGSTGVSLLAQEQNSVNYWLRPFDGSKRWIEVYRKHPDKTFHRYGTPFKILPEMDVFDIFPENDGVTWIGSTVGLFRYDSKIPKDYEAGFYALIRKVTIGKDSVLFSGSYFDINTDPGSITKFSLATEQKNSNKPVLPFDKNSIRFEFAVPHYEKQSNNRISYYLDGYDEGWSEWTTETKKEYTNLPEGKYEFFVKGLNVYDIESKTASYQFEILPPLYRTYSAFSGYFVMTILFLILLVRFNTQRLRREKLKLAKMVRESTHEIRAQKAVIEEKNEKITSSINYALRIQNAMLPRLNVIEKGVDDFFIFLKPRDIVSGDFYWFTEVDNKLVIAAVDCTGHGVPGAIMSMIGLEQLTEIVNTKKITQTNLILNNLHSGIREILKQEETKNRDGMDLGICCYDKENKTLEFSGAKRPLIYIQNNDLVELKGDKLGVGGVIEGSDRDYGSNKISVDYPTTCYLFSDGFQDQFGGPEDRKFMLKNLKELLLDIHHKPMKEQKTILEETIQEWKGDSFQVDDILIIGFKFQAEI